MRKRISSVLAGLLAALLLWGLAPVTAEAAGASFSGSGSVRAGDSVTVTFTVSGSNIQGITAVLHYDSSALTLTGTRQLVGSSWSVDMSGGNLLAYDQSLSNPITGSAAVLAVTFQVKSGVAAGTRVSATITDIVATDGNSDQSLNDASWAASVAAPPSGNANLAGLSCGDYALSPAFSAGTTEYSVTVPYDVSRLPLDYRAADGGADVAVVLLVIQAQTLGRDAGGNFVGLHPLLEPLLHGGLPAGGKLPPLQGDDEVGQLLAGLLLRLAPDLVAAAVPGDRLANIRVLFHQ